MEHFLHISSIEPINLRRLPQILPQSAKFFARTIFHLCLQDIIFDECAPAGSHKKDDSRVHIYRNCLAESIRQTTWKNVLHTKLKILKILLYSDFEIQNSLYSVKYYWIKVFVPIQCISRPENCPRNISVSC